LKKKVKDSLRKDTTNKNVDREIKDCLKKKHSEADAKEVVSNPKSPTSECPPEELECRAGANIRS